MAAICRKLDEEICSTEIILIKWFMNSLNTIVESDERVDSNMYLK